MRGEKPIPLIRSAIYALFENKAILFPFCLIVFVETFVLILLYFYPRFPLNIFFAPFITKLWSAEFLHYPNNLLLLPKLFQYALIPIYLFIGSYFIACSVNIIKKLNDNKTIVFGVIFFETMASYIHIVLASILSFTLVFMYFKLYQILYDRAMMIRSPDGIFYFIRNLITLGAPYFNLLFSIIVTILFAYVVPFIVIEHKKIHQAIWLNFKMLLSTFWTTCCVIFLPSLLYIPVLLLRNMSFTQGVFPERTLYILFLSILMTVAIDALIYTALTTSFLIKMEKE